MTMFSVTACSSGIKVNRSEYGSRWPFEATSVIIDCEDRGDTIVPTVEVEGLKYSLHPNAKRSGGYGLANKAFRPDIGFVGMLGTKSAIPDMRKRAFAICGVGDPY